jgi:hypothetical protein
VEDLKWHGGRVHSSTAATGCNGGWSNIVLPFVMEEFGSNAVPVPFFFYSVNTYPAHASFMNDYGRGMMLGLTKSPVVSMSSQSIQPIVFGALNI